MSMTSRGFCYFKFLTSLILRWLLVLNCKVSFFFLTKVSKTCKFRSFILN